MNKIICDVCGTSYPETVEQCPICGCVRPADVQNTMPDSEANESGSGYTYVKGGRFSKGNVKKRVKTAPAAPQYIEEERNPGSNAPSDGRKPLIATALVLLAAIILVVIYITIRFFGMNIVPQDYTDNKPNSIIEPSSSLIPCVNLEISDETVSLTEVGSAWLLNVQKSPADTTDEIFCSAENEAVATAALTSSGKIKITAVGAGETIVEVSCGEQKHICKVICEFTSEDNNPPVVNNDNYTVNDIIFNSRYNPPEATLRSEGETWNCYKGKIPVDQITWKSDDESVATVKDGVVTAVGKGSTKIHAIWNGHDLTCTVRCNFITTATGIPGSDDVELG